jgi:multiple sugar transport system ATP-binding protein
MTRVQITSLTKEFPGEVRAIDDLTLEIAAGEFFALLGPSGCGKTTLLRTIAGLESATSGTISFDGKDVTALPPGERNVGMVFQDYALYPHMSIADNVTYPLKIRKVPKEDRRRAAEEVAASLQLGHLLDRRPGELSGGQQQRAALARSVAYRPDLFLFDEPLSNLDARLRLEARTFLKRLQQELGITTIYVTHDQSEALALVDRMAVMQDGRMRQIGSPSELYHRPANLFVAGFIGSTPMNLLEGVSTGKAVRVGGFELPVPDHARGSLPEGAKVVFGARPEYVSLSLTKIPDSVEGRVEVLENLGPEYLVTVECEGFSIKATTPEGEEPAVGDRAWAAPETARSLVYRAEDGELVGAPRLTATGS